MISWCEIAEIHEIAVLPRVLFEQWTPEEIVDINSDNQKKSQLVAVLVETAKVMNKIIDVTGAIIDILQVQKAIPVHVT